MNLLDVILIVPLLWAAYRGFKKGLIIELTGIIAFGLGIWGAIHLSDYIAEILVDKVDQEYLSLIAFTVTFILLVAGVFVLGKMIEKGVNLLQLKFLNKLFGATFGVLKVALIISVLLVILNGYERQRKILPSEMKENSVLFKPFTSYSLKIIPALQNSNFSTTSSILPQEGISSL